MTVLGPVGQGPGQGLPGPAHTPLPHQEPILKQSVYLQGISFSLRLYIRQINKGLFIFHFPSQPHLPGDPFLLQRRPPRVPRSFPSALCGHHVSPGASPRPCGPSSRFPGRSDPGGGRRRRRRCLPLNTFSTLVICCNYQVHFSLIDVIKYI